MRQVTPMYDTAAGWTASDPILPAGWEGIESDTGKRKFGDGATIWSSLAYFSDPAGTASVSDTAYDATSWNGVTTVAPSKNAVRDKFESLSAVPVKATGAEINTGTDDAKFVTAKAITDSDVAFLADIPAPGSSNVGYLNSPINSQSDNYTCVLLDSGKTILETGASKTVTIPANASVAYPVGTCLSIICTNASGCSIAITSDTMTLANSTTTGTRTLAQNGRATAQKMTSTTWLISGVGLT